MDGLLWDLYGVHYMLKLTLSDYETITYVRPQHVVVGDKTGYKSFQCI